MTFRLIALLLLASHLPSRWPAAPSPDSVVRQLYQEVVARRPLGIPKGADKAAIGAFLSKELLQKLETAQACQDDYLRQHTDRDNKPEFDWLEMGLFSGGNEQALPSAAAVKRTVPQKDGSFSVHVRLTYKESSETYDRPPNPANTLHWRVVAVVISEDGKFVVDDVLFFKDDSTKIESRLTGFFRGCDGPRWVGDRK